MVDEFFARIFSPLGHLLYKYFLVWISPRSPLGPITAGALVGLCIGLIILSLI